MIECRLIGEPDAANRTCFDCHHCKGAVTSWWCMSEEARAHRGTGIPGARDCPFWKPCRPPSWWDRWFGSAIIIEARK